MVLLFDRATWRGSHNGGSGLRFLVFCQSLWLWFSFIFDGLLMFLQRKFRCLTLYEFFSLLFCELMRFLLMCWTAFYLSPLFKLMCALDLLLGEDNCLVPFLFCISLWRRSCLLSYALNAAPFNTWYDYHSL